jgi:hypothetical protein
MPHRLSSCQVASKAAVAQNEQMKMLEHALQNAAKQMLPNCDVEEDWGQRDALMRRNRKQRRRFGWNRKWRSAHGRIDKNPAP